MTLPTAPTTRPPRLPRGVRAVIVLSVVFAAVALAGCGSTASRVAPSPTASAADTGYRVVSASAVTAGRSLPVPTGPVVLTVSGHLAAGVTGPVRLDLAGLESLGLVEFSAMDKQAEGRRATFRGVLLSRLLAVVGAAGATTLHTLAINDFAVDIPVSDAAAHPVLLATSVDGKRMPVDRYGPVRVVYPTDGTHFDSTIYDPRWIWQLTTIVVE